MRRMIGIGMVTILLACGCAPQEQAQRALITQMQEGIAQVEAWQQERQLPVDGFYGQQRRALDEGFDADVRMARELEPEWVIEARVAYVAGLEAVWGARQASAVSAAHAQANLAAVREGLERLSWMSELRENWARAVGDVTKEVRR